MNFGFEIKRYMFGDGGFIYTYQIDGDTQNELDKFLNNPANISSPEFEDLTQRLQDMHDSLGFQELFFKLRESILLDNVVALHYESKGLRLYCIRNGNILLIAGNGGIKGPGPYQQYPFLNEKVEELAYIDKRFFDRLNTGELEMLPTGELNGDLIFEEE